MEKQQMLALSTSALSPETLRWLREDYDFFNHDVTVYPKRDFGFFICVSDVPASERANLPDDLHRLITHAEATGYDWIMFDEDADPEAVYQFSTHSNLRGDK